MSEVVFSPAMWPAYHVLMRADFQLFDEYRFLHEGMAPAAARRSVTRSQPYSLWLLNPVRPAARSNAVPAAVPATSIRRCSN